ncbi:MAG TPA: NADH-quinone oxidoreductase subunit N [Candidatus Eisenbacteria bacterium]|nr:NADH-quinone oxidoreductase subunit N [Candidatus Eisenbacteria bacterium]
MRPALPPLQFIMSSTDAMSLLPVWVLTGVALLALTVDLFSRKRGAMWSAWVSLIGLFATGLAIWQVRGLDRTVFAGMVRVDPFSQFFSAVIVGVTIVSVLFSWDYLKRTEILRGEYYALMLFAALGMIFMAQANDLIMVFLGLELMSLALYVLAGFRLGRMESTEAAMKYFLLGAFASGFLLYGIAFLYGATGSTNLERISGYLIESPLAGSPLVLLGIALALVGFAFKIAAVPFHMWTPDAYEGAPTSVTAFMAAGSKAAAFAALVRVSSMVLAHVPITTASVLEVVAILTLVVGNVVAILQSNLKRMLAYSSIAHAGYALVGVIAGGPDGHAAVLFYMATYAAMTLGAFGTLTLLGRGMDERVDVRELGGVGKRHPILAALFTLFMLGLAGIPPTAGFVGKLYLFRAGVETHHVQLVIVALLASVVSVYYYLRPVVVMYMQEPSGSPVEVSRSGAASVALAISASITLVVGVLPGGLADSALRSVLSLLP